MIERILYIATWAWLAWSAVAFVIGGGLVWCDEQRFRRAAPRPADVRAYADRLVARHGQEAFARHGDAIRQAVLSKDFDGRRFMNDVSKELVDRLVQAGSMSSRSCDDIRKTG